METSTRRWCRCPRGQMCGVDMGCWQLSGLEVWDRVYEKLFWGNWAAGVTFMPSGCHEENRF